MTRVIPSFLALVAALALSGCLLPQPDTPIIPPLKPDAGRNSTTIGVPAAQPNTRTQPAPDVQPVTAPVPPEQATGMLAPSAPGTTTDAAAPTTAGVPGRLEVELTGRDVVRLTATPTQGGAGTVGEVGPDGTIALSLPPGEYFLDLEVEGEATPLRVDARFVIVSEETRHVTVTLNPSAPEATVTEEVPLAPRPSLSPAAP